MSLTAPFLNERLVDFLIYRFGDAEVVVRFGAIGCNAPCRLPKVGSRATTTTTGRGKFKTDVVVRPGDNANHRRSGDLHHRSGRTEFCRPELATSIRAHYSAGEGFEYFGMGAIAPRPRRSQLLRV